MIYKKGGVSWVILFSFIFVTLGPNHLWALSKDVPDHTLRPPSRIASIVNAVRTENQRKNYLPTLRYNQPEAC